VGTPLPRSTPGIGAISVAKRTAVFTIWRNASGRTDRATCSTGADLTPRR
jgi:hypothetical protein